MIVRTVRHETKEQAKARDAWEALCIKVFKRVCKHELVDPANSRRIADFHNSVLHTNPGIWGEYTALIPEPMDLSTVDYDLQCGNYDYPAEFFHSIFLVFDNAVRYNAQHTESRYATEIAVRCKQLVKYVTWVGLEVLPYPGNGPTASIQAASSSSSSVTVLSTASVLSSASVSSSATATATATATDAAEDCATAVAAGDDIGPVSASASCTADDTAIANDTAAATDANANTTTTATVAADAISATTDNIIPSASGTVSGSGGASVSASASASGSASTSASGSATDIPTYLTVEDRDRERAFRLEILRATPVGSNVTDINRLFRKLEANNKREMYYFEVAVNVELVPDYYEFVRRPMHYNRVKQKVEQNMYDNFMAVVDDINLIFANAKAYNKTHLQSDEISLKVYNSAVILEEKLAKIVYEDYSIEIADKVLRLQIIEDERKALEGEKKKRCEAEEREIELFKTQELARLVREDVNFAYDLSVQAKRQYSEDDLRVHRSLLETYGDVVGDATLGSIKTAHSQRNRLSLPTDDSSTVHGENRCTSDSNDNRNKESQSQNQASSGSESLNIDTKIGIEKNSQLPMTPNLISFEEKNALRAAAKKRIASTAWGHWTSSSVFKVRKPVPIVNQEHTLRTASTVSMSVCVEHAFTVEMNMHRNIKNFDQLSETKEIVPKLNQYHSAKSVLTK